MLWVGEPFFEMWLCISLVAAVAKIKAQDWTDTLMGNLKTAQVAPMHGKC